MRILRIIPIFFVKKVVSLRFVSLAWIQPYFILDRGGSKYHCVSYGLKYIKFIFILIKLFVKLLYSHTFRKGNSLAHGLARHVIDIPDFPGCRDGPRKGPKGARAPPGSKKKIFLVGKVFQETKK